MAWVAGLGVGSSVGRTGVCWNNSVTESFFSILKDERLYRTVYATKAHARKDMIRYIKGLQNSRSRHSALGYRRLTALTKIPHSGSLPHIRAGLPRC